MTTIQYAWAIYLGGALGCSVAAWWMLLWAWRFVRYAAVATVMTILLTPYAIDPQTMTMAPAIYTLVFDGLGQGIEAVKPLIKLMVGIWLIAIILIVVFLVLTRKSVVPEPPELEKVGRTKHHSHKPARKANYKQRAVRVPGRGVKRKSRQADDSHESAELLRGEIPIRAIRD